MTIVLKKIRLSSIIIQLLLIGPKQLNFKISFAGSSPIPNANAKFCHLTESSTVAPWDKHTAIEVDNLIQMQKSLFPVPNSCLKSLSKYLCLPATKCYQTGHATDISSDFKTLCKAALKAW